MVLFTLLFGRRQLEPNESSRLAAELQEPKAQHLIHLFNLSNATFTVCQRQTAAADADARHETLQAAAFTPEITSSLVPREAA